MYPKVGQVWTNNNTNLRETIIRVGDRIITQNFDCHYELFLETYSIDVGESIKNIQKKVNILLADLDELKNLFDTGTQDPTRPSKYLIILSHTENS